MNEHYGQILSKFQILGYVQTSTLSKQAMMEALDNISIAVTNNRFDETIANQLWQEGKSQLSRKIVLKDLIQKIQQGVLILEQQYKEILNQLESSKDAERKDLLLMLFTVQRNHKLLSNSFEIPALQHNQYFYKSLAYIPQKIRNENNYIFSFELNEETQGLKFVLWIAMLCLGLEMAMMFHKFHFYSLLCLCSVLSIFFLNYFDSSYIRLVIANLLISSLMDVIWQIVNAKAFWSGKNNLTICRSHSSLLKMIIFLVAGMAVAKMMMAALLLKFRNNPPNYRTHLEFLDIKFNLDGNPQSNPITKLLNS